MEVLLATDGSSPADKAVSLLEKIGNRDGLNVTVFSVVSFALALEQGAAKVGHYSVEEGRRYVATAVDRSVAELTDAGFTATGRIADGDPALEIVSAAEQGAHDLVLLGSGSTSWIGQLMLGSVSNKVLHGSSSSVLIVHKVLDDDNGSVLVGVDGSDGSQAAVRCIEGFADPARTRVSVMAVAAAGASENASRLGIPESEESPEGIKEIKEKVLAEAHDHSAVAAERLRDAGFEVDTIVHPGSPAELLLKEAESGDFDVVAVGARGSGPFPRTILGSVSDKVARSAAAALIGRAGPPTS